MQKAIILFLIWILITTLSCKQHNNDIQISDPIQTAIKSKYFAEHTAGYISVKDGFTFRLNEAYSDDQRTEVSGVKIKPKVDGRWSWDNGNTISFRPDETMKYGQKYTVSIMLNELLENDEHPSSPISFQITSRELKFSVSFNGLKISQSNNGDELSLEGIIYTTDYVDPKIIESAFFVSQNNAEPQVNWEHTSNGQRHFLSINKISQHETEDTDLTIKWDGKKWEKSFIGEQIIPINAKEKFAQTDIKISSSPDRFIRIFYSRPLKNPQNLSGLVSLDGSIRDIKTNIVDNVLFIYPKSTLEGNFDLTVSKSIQSFDGQRLSSESNQTLRFDYHKPDLRMVGNGMIIPNSNESYMPIEVINLTAVDIEIFKIFENNILQYLQSNNLNGNYSLSQVGRIVHREKIAIDGMNDEQSRNKWTRVGINLKDYINSDPASIYQVRLGFQSSYAITECDEQSNQKIIVRSGDESMINYTNDYYENWENRDDPCSRSYYSPDRVIQQNLLFSDVGVIAKQGGQNQYHIAVNSLSKGNSIDNATVSFYDYQQQLIMEGKSNGNGFLTVKTENEASFLVVSHTTGHAYVKLNDQNSNSLTDFEIGGTQRNEGVDGFIYADRGAHRPGDTMFINFMLDDTDRPLPLHHPVTLEIRDPKGNKKYDLTTSDHVERIYAFAVPTESNDLTGQWRAIIKVGAHQITKPLRVETIKPNRLKIEVSTPDELDYSQQSQRNVNLTSRWLHGASADGLKVKVDGQYKNTRPSFKGYDNYAFMDPARQGSQALVNIFDKNLDENGQAEFPIRISPEAFPGKVIANIKSRVFENGGNFSESHSSFKISPFNTYVGVNTPENRWGDKSVKIGDNATFKIVSLSADGKKAADRNLTVGIYNIDWRWWYYQGERYNIYRLNSAEHKDAFYTDNVKSNANGELDLTIDFQDVEYGRKLIRICDDESGHCTGEFFYVRGWGQSNVDQERESLAKLNFNSDKKEYNVGEKVKVIIPSEKGSKILISLETGNDVIMKEWIEGLEGSTDYEFTASQNMSPNIYVHAIMVQSYDTKENDLPLRMYGVVPIKVTDPKSILLPQIDLAEKLEPKEKFTIKVTEQNGKPMAYTIAIIDEGLLDLTNFNTPSPHDHFFAKQSLGVKTWDLYEHVMTDINGSVDRIITVGGDDDGSGPGGAKKAIRFKPVVMTAGPFYIHNGESRAHTFEMPNYIGSVRAMVIAKKEKAYGHNEVTVPVKKDVMILPTMPRVVGPGEIVSIPVSVFANESHVKNVTVKIESTPNFEMISSTSKKVTFSKTGEKMIFFKAKVKNKLGVAKVNISAKSGNQNIDQNIEIDIRNPNPYESLVYDQVIEPGESWNTNLDLVGIEGTNEGLIELSAIPPMNLERRLEYLTSYPYGCVEQTVSAAFPQLSLEKVIDVDYNREKKIEKNINSAIRRLSKLQNANGGMSYWPGSKQVSRWGTSYAGHFMIQSKDKGYYVPTDLLASWAEYQTKASREFRMDRSRKRWHQQWEMKDQAYRLYALALYGNPELPSMNVLRQEIDLPPLAKYLLAATYALSGKAQIANDLIKNTSIEVNPYNELAYSYGSDLRDMALIAQTLMTLEKTQVAGQVVKRIADKLSSNKWYSTQTLSHALLAVSDYVSTYERDDLKFSIDIADNGNQEVNYKKPIYLYSFNPEKSEQKKASIQNMSKDVLFARITVSGQKSPSEVIQSPSYNRNITLDVTYKSMNGEKIDPSELERGTDFIAHVTVKNQNSRGNLLDEMALSQIFPSGWEIQSGGLNNLDETLKEDSYDYRDVRDDRVYTFFDLGDKKEYKVMLTAAYDGEYFLPPISCKAMYDNEIQAKTKGMKVKVLTPSP